MTSVPEAPIELRRERLRRKFRQLREDAPRSLAAHAEFVHSRDDGSAIRPAALHREWIRWLEDPDERWLCVVAPPGTGKSVWFDEVFVTQAIGRARGNIRVGLICNTATQAYNRARAVRRAVESRRFRMAYPDVRPDYDRGWTEAQFWTTGNHDDANPTVLATGLFGPMQGRRFDLEVIDDPTNPEEAESPQIMQKQRDRLTRLIFKRFPLGMGPPDGEGRCVVVLTRWGPDDLVELLAERGFRILNYPALGYWDRIEHDDGTVEYGTESLWPEILPAERLLAERDEDQITFDLVMQGDATAVTGELFSLEHFRRGHPPDPDEFEKVTQYVDPSEGIVGGDWFTIATVGVRDQGREAWVLGMLRERITTDRQPDAVIGEYERWTEWRRGGPEGTGKAIDLVGIEGEKLGKSLYNALLSTARLPLRLVPVTESKTWRATPLAGAYRGDRVWHPKVGDEIPRWVKVYEGELRSFPRGRHDDTVDAAAGAYNLTVESGFRVRILTR